MSKKLFIASLAMGAALALSPLATIGATAFKAPGTAVQIDSVVELAKKKGKKAKKAKKAKSKAGKCGTYKYWHKKTRKCVDARGKK